MPELDIDNAAADIASDLGFSSDDSVQNEVQEEHVATEATNATEVVEQADPYREPPKSWKKEWHEKWNTVAPDVREIFYTREKQMLDGIDQYKSGYEIGSKLSPVFDQHRDFLKSQGVDEVQAVQYLLSAQQRLMTGTPEQKREMIMNLARGVGVELTQAQQEAAAGNPEITAVMEKVQGLESVLRSQYEAQAKQVRDRVSTEVEAFASQPEHEFFNDVAVEITQFINAGLDLQTAYDRAVWANPVTRQKQIEKAQTEHYEKQKAKAKEEAEAALKAKAPNVRTRASNKAPTEPLGSWDDTMKETLAKVKAGAL